MRLRKVVNGREVPMTAREEAALRAEWAKPTPTPPPVSEKRVSLVRAIVEMSDEEIEALPDA